MFSTLWVLGVILIIVGIVLIILYKTGDLGSPFGGPAAIAIGLLMIVLAFLTPHGRIVWGQFVASGAGSNWLVVDNSGGKTLRHWILEDRYVKSSEQSDGWQFKDEFGNLSYVSGDAFVLQIKQDLKVFLTDYKVRYSIPEEQVALN